jgi:hypothetical protein
MFKSTLKPNIRRTFKVQRRRPIILNTAAIPAEKSVEDILKLYDSVGIMFVDKVTPIVPTVTLSRYRVDLKKLRRQWVRTMMTPKQWQQLRARIYFGKARLSRYMRRIRKMTELYDNITKQI